MQFQLKYTVLDEVGQVSLRSLYPYLLYNGEDSVFIHLDFLTYQRQSFCENGSIIFWASGKKTYVFKYVLS